MADQMTRPVGVGDARAGDYADGPGAALWRAANLWRRRQCEALAPSGLTPGQYLLLDGLVRLAGPGGGVSQALLARQCRADQMMTSQILRDLEELGLVRRGRHPGDARAVAITPTAAGRRRLDVAGPAVEAAQAAFFGALGADAQAFAGALGLLAGEKPRRRVAAGRH